MDLPTKPRTALDELRDMLAEEKVLNSRRQRGRFLTLAAIGSEDFALVGWIAEEVAREAKVSASVMRSRSRASRICDARHTAVYLMREIVQLSYPQIGAYFGRDHSTAIHSFNLTEMRQVESSEFKKRLAKITKAVYERRVQEAAA